MHAREFFGKLEETDLFLLDVTKRPHKLSFFKRGVTHEKQRQYWQAWAEGRLSTIAEKVTDSSEDFDVCLIDQGYGIQKSPIADKNRAHVSEFIRTKLKKHLKEQLKYDLEMSLMPKRKKGDNISEFDRMKDHLILSAAPHEGRTGKRANIHIQEDGSSGFFSFD